MKKVEPNDINEDVFVELAKDFIIKYLKSDKESLAIMKTMCSKRYLYEEVFVLETVFGNAKKALEKELGDKIY